MLFTNMSANDIHTLSMLGIINPEKGKQYLETIKEYSKDRLKRYQPSKSTFEQDRQAIEVYYRQQAIDESNRKQAMKDELSFLFA